MNKEIIQASNAVKVIKIKNNRPTVIEWKGWRYVLDLKTK